MNVDLINGAFEFFGAYFTWKNTFVLYKEKVVKGVYWPTTAFFTVYGLWLLLYFYEIKHIYSLIGGMLIVSGNMLWVVLALKFRSLDNK